MLRRLRLLHVPFWTRSPSGFLLPAAGVALGVATIVAIDLAGASAVRSFRETLARLDGRTTHRVTGVRVPDDLARTLAAIPGVEAAAPVVEAVALYAPDADPPSGGLRPSEAPTAREGPPSRGLRPSEAPTARADPPSRGLRPSEAPTAREDPPSRGLRPSEAPTARADPYYDKDPLRLFGVDPLAEGAVRTLGVEEVVARHDGDAQALFRDFLGRPGALLVSSGFLRRNRLAPGDPLPLVVGARRRTPFVLAALPREVNGLEVPDNLAVGDIATVQELAGRMEGVDRVDLVLAERGRDQVLAAVRAALPEDLRIERPGGRAGRLERGLAAFRANVRALSYLALFVSFFLIYNSLVISVLRRRPLLAIARCLGATRGEVLSGWLAEALVTGAIGVLAGWALGLAFAAPALRGVARTAADLYGGSASAELELDPVTFLKAGVLGMAFTVVSALLPVREAAATPPAHAGARSGVERDVARGRRAARLAAAALLAVVAAALLWPTSAATPGYVAAAGTALAAALLVPDALDLGLRGALSRRWRFSRGLLRMAAANLRASRSRTGVAVAALTVALGMSVAMGTLVRSFRADLIDWIEASVRADVYVSPLGVQADRESATLPPDLAERLAAMPGVAAVDSYRGGEIVAAGRDAFLAAVDAPVLRRRAEWPLLAGGPRVVFFDRLEAGEAGISESLQRKSGLRLGDSLTVAFRGRRHELRIAGVYRDYSTDQGVVLVDRSAFSRRADLGPPRSLALYLDAGTDPARFVDELQRGVGRELALLVRSNRSLRERALTVFDRTFSITRTLEVIGLGVAAIGVLGALLSMLLERGRELATLRALGLTRRQLAGLFLRESTLLAFFAWVFAVVLGAALAWIILAVINVRSFGWAIAYRIPWGAWALALVASLAAAWIATLWPLRRLAGLRVAPLLRDE